MDFVALCKDYRIDVVSSHHHVSPGWLGVHCPFCPGSKNYHLGFNPKSHAFSCWRCGTHELPETLERLTGERFRVLWAKYGGKDNSTTRPVRRKRRERDDKPKAELRLPKGFLEPLRLAHARYLERRGFDPEHLQREWGIASTSPTAQLGDMRYNNRIFIPVHWEHRLVTFQCRATKSIPGKEHMKYLACDKEYEALSIRSVLYRHPDVMSEAGICVEGATDVWRLGRHAFAMLGIGYSQSQITVAARAYKRVMVVFDPEPVAQARARKVANELGMLGVETWVHELHGDRDPGELSEREAARLTKRLLAH